MHSLDTLPGIPTDVDGPVFAEPWHAMALALAVNLRDAGRITWSELSQSLGVVLVESAESGKTDDGSHYYHHFLIALERVAVTNQLVAGTELLERKHAWEEAYHRTQHGQPVELPHDCELAGSDATARNELKGKRWTA